MQFFSESLTLKTKTFELLRDLIHERLGIYLEEGKQDLLRDKLSPLLISKGFDSFMDYYYFLKYDCSDSEWEAIADAITVAESYFFRESDQIFAAVDILVPEFLRSYPDRELLIWSAACASGEEPLSIAIALDEKGWLQRQEIKIVGTDVSMKNLEKARRGVYKEWSFRGVPEKYIKGYFVETEGGKKILDRIHTKVRFEHLNLMDLERVKEFARAPIIFCRNVFIYFSEENIRKVVSCFYENMPVPGYLFLAACESLFRIFPKLELKSIGEAFVYVKSS